MKLLLPKPRPTSRARTRGNFPQPLHPQSVFRIPQHAPAAVLELADDRDSRELATDRCPRAVHHATNYHSGKSPHGAHRHLTRS
ncbi:hypothetical protein PoB_005244800 [Plakobranchus ocellatus]|uniref:Uncharacterized protein n=1 Tax=Plakobranchus ocellatus TaxID=259542 RepID=A0AAV4C208_9GAST|nr:hypothetical protein PoB_005244800 [Plakobranchus ocellatus]